VLLKPITANEIADALHSAGIWDIADLRKHDRKLIRIGTNLIGHAVWTAAQKVEA